MAPPNANASPDSYAPRIHGLPQEFITLVYTERGGQESMIPGAFFWPLPDMRDTSQGTAALAFPAGK